MLLFNNELFIIYRYDRKFPKGSCFFLRAVLRLCFLNMNVPPVQCLVLLFPVADEVPTQYLFLKYCNAV